MDERGSVIYISAVGHCGSTLLSRLLGAHPKVRSIGSIKGLERREQVEAIRCSCGKHLGECGEWSGEGQSVLFGWSFQGLVAAHNRALSAASGPVPLSVATQLALSQVPGNINERRVQ